MNTELHHLQMALVAYGVACALVAIVGTLIQARRFSLWQTYGFKIFEILYVAKYGERRNNNRPLTERRRVTRY